MDNMKTFPCICENYCTPTFSLMCNVAVSVRGPKNGVLSKQRFFWKLYLKTTSNQPIRNNVINRPSINYWYSDPYERAYCIGFCQGGVRCAPEKFVTLFNSTTSPFCTPLVVMYSLNNRIINLLYPDLKNKFAFIS